MVTFVEIVVNVPRVAGVFHYHLPPELEGRVEVGHLVVVPFGDQTVQGVVLREVEEPEVPETKAVMALVDERPVVTRAQLALAEHLSESTLAPLAACVDLMLPVGLRKQADTLYELTEKAEDESIQLNRLQTRVVALLHKRGALRGRQIERAMPPKVNWRAGLKRLEQLGVVSTEPILPLPTIRPKYVRTAQLAVPPEKVDTQIESLPASWTTARERREEILRFLAGNPDPVDVNWVYATSGGNLTDLQRLEELDLILLREQEAWRDPLAGLDYDPSTPPTLTADQRRAWEAIETQIKAKKKNGKPFLLHGVTGSGKTEIYLRAVAETLAKGRQAIVLVPEISLTPQTTRRFIARFPGRVGLVHSQLSEGERFDTWRRARAGKLAVIVGPRSALFTPLPDLGLIVVDESHDETYYQSDFLPYYHARLAAIAYARICNGVCILGSATPDVTSFFQARQGRWRLLELPSRILAHAESARAHAAKLGRPTQYHPLEAQAEALELPQVEIVDMREELKAGNRSIFSRALEVRLGRALAQGEQVILFLNRRGSATYVFCRDCGYVLKCPRCDNPLTHHEHESSLTCHHCGYRRGMPESCPNCQSERIRQYGMGTEAVEKAVQETFPEARTLRWDWDTTREKGAHDIILSHFSNQRADILIGTQMLAKGLDLPLVTLVGVVLADVGLHLPDYRAGERVFQVLSQVAGRAGRSPLGGQVVLQTFHPDHYVIRAAAQHDYKGFYEKELGYRKELRYPPYAQLVRLEYRHAQDDRAEAEAMRMGEQIQHWIEAEGRRATDAIGPAPCFYSRRAGEYRWQILLRGPQPATLLKGKNLGDWRVEVNPQALL